ncbi:hypothetical protein Dimus_005194 [Dionaea muscipula]
MSENRLQCFRPSFIIHHLEDEECSLQTIQKMMKKPPTSSPTLRMMRILIAEEARRKFWYRRLKGKPRTASEKAQTQDLHHDHENDVLDKSLSIHINDQQYAYVPPIGINASTQRDLNDNLMDLAASCSDAEDHTVSWTSWRPANHGDP